MSRPFQPGDLTGLDGVEPTGAELADVASIARQVEGLAASEGVHPSVAFVESVMGAVAVEPLPQPAIAAGIAARRGHFGAMLAALADSWRVATSRDRPFAVRAQALAFVMVAVLAVGSVGGAAAVGAWQLLGPHPAPTIAPTPDQGPSPTLPPVPTTSPEPSPTPEPSESAEPSDSPEPSETAEPSSTDDHGGSPDSTEKPSKTASPTRRPSPTPSDTPEPSDTPDGEQTPKPSDDH